MGLLYIFQGSADQFFDDLYTSIKKGYTQEFDDYGITTEHVEGFIEQLTELVARKKEESGK
jgi:hypothetical protein